MWLDDLSLHNYLRLSCCLIYFIYVLLKLYLWVFLIYKLWWVYLLLAQILLLMLLLQLFYNFCLRSLNIDDLIECICLFCQNWPKIYTTTCSSPKYLILSLIRCWTIYSLLWWCQWNQTLWYQWLFGSLWIRFWSVFLINAFVVITMSSFIFLRFWSSLVTIATTILQFIYWWDRWFSYFSSLCKTFAHACTLLSLYIFH